MRFAHRRTPRLLFVVLVVLVSIAGSLAAPSAGANGTAGGGAAGPSVATLHRGVPTVLDGELVDAATVAAAARGARG